MKSGKRLPQEIPELSYFELQAYIGATKHMGGFETTQELFDLCHTSQGTTVLDVGCGVGATACYLAKEYGCRVVGVDLRESMVALSNERAQNELTRVVKPDGYVGFNEEIWLETPPAEVVAHVKRAWEVKPDRPTAANLIGLALTALG